MMDSKRLVPSVIPRRFYENAVRQMILNASRRDRSAKFKTRALKNDATRDSDDGKPETRKLSEQQDSSNLRSTQSMTNNAHH